MALKHFFSATGDVATPVVFDFDPSIAPFNVALWVVLTNTNNATYTVEITIDDLEINGRPNPNAVWLPDPQFSAGGTIMGFYSAPISAARFTVSNLTTAGASVNFKSRQGDVIH